MKGVAAAILMGLLAISAPRPPSQPVKVQNAVDGVFAAFRDHPLVGIGDAHAGLAQEGAFYAQLVRDPRFARDVGNVVFEFGSSAYQASLDRYLNGEDVPYTELRKVWRETPDALGTVVPIQYSAFLAQIRAVNQTLPSGPMTSDWGTPRFGCESSSARGSASASSSSSRPAKASASRAPASVPSATPPRSSVAAVQKYSMSRASQGRCPTAGARSCWSACRTSSSPRVSPA